MAFDIEKMKRDGVSSHLIELASMSQETLLLLTARRLENDKFFQQFLGANAGEIEEMYPYAVAAGLMSEEDRKWLLDEGNPYKPQGGEGEVWFVGDTGYEQEEMIIFELSNIVDTDYIAELYTNAENYQVFLNGEELPTLDQDQSAHLWLDGDTTSYTKMVQIVYYNNQYIAIAAYANTSTVPESVEVTVMHK